MFYKYDAFLKARTVITIGPESKIKVRAIS
jgi:hypothetical protein